MSNKNLVDRDFVVLTDGNKAACTFCRLSNPYGDFLVSLEIYKKRTLNKFYLLLHGSEQPVQFLFLNHARTVGDSWNCRWPLHIFELKPMLRAQNFHKKNKKTHCKFVTHYIIASDILGWALYFIRAYETGWVIVHVAYLHSSCAAQISLMTTFIRLDSRFELFFYCFIFILDSRC